MYHYVNIFHNIIHYRHYATNPLLFRNVSYFYIFFLVFFGGLTIISLKRIKGAKENILSLDKTQQLRGIAILMIVSGHFFDHVLNLSPEKYILPTLAGNGVQIFLILSGFGIMSSYLAKGIKKFWLLDKYLRIWIPYVIPTLIWIVVDFKLLSYHHSLPFTLLTLLGIYTHNTWAAYDFNMWFVTFILLQYVFFYVAFHIKNVTNTQKALIVALLNAIFLVFADKVLSTNYSFGGIWGFVDHYSIFFPIGIFLALYFGRIQKVIRATKTSTAILVLILVAGVCLLEGSLFQGGEMWSLLFFVSLFFIGTLLGYFSRFLYFIGGISYEIYLIHGPLMYRYDFLLFRRPFFLFYPIYFGIIVLLAFALFTLSRFLLAKIRMVIKI